jgi:hypothetical protein
LKSNILWDMGKKDEAQTVANAAIAKGKADKVNTAAFENELLTGRPQRRRSPFRLL